MCINKGGPRTQVSNYFSCNMKWEELATKNLINIPRLSDVIKMYDDYICHLSSQLFLLLNEEPLLVGIVILSAIKDWFQVIGS